MKRSETKQSKYKFVRPLGSTRVLVKGIGALGQPSVGPTSCKPCVQWAGCIALFP